MRTTGDDSLRRRLMVRLDWALQEGRLPDGAGSWSEFDQVKGSAALCIQGTTDDGRRMGVVHSFHDGQTKWFGD